MLSPLSIAILAISLAILISDPYFSKRVLKDEHEKLEEKTLHESRDSEEKLKEF